MPDFKVRNIPPKHYKFLKRQAKEHGRSMSAELREMIIEAVRSPFRYTFVPSGPTLIELRRRRKRAE